MLALVKTKRASGAELTEVDPPKPGPDEVLLKIHRASICGSDLSIYFWKSWAVNRIKPPLVFGHEICGEIVELGKDVNGFSVGDKVAVESHIYCGGCASCAAGDKHLCRRMALIGIDTNGGFAEYLALPRRVLWKLGGSVSYDEASLLEPLGNAIYATGVEPVEDKTVLVLGCGPQGLFAVQVARARGASLVVGVERSVFRANLAKKFGAHHVIRPEDGAKDLLERLLSFSQTKEGFDVCLEMSGSPALAPLAFQALRNGGRLSLFGTTAGKMGIDLGEDIVFRGLRIYGILGRRIFDTWVEMEQLLDSGKINLGAIITHRLPLTQAHEAFEIFSSPDKNCGKIIFEVDK